MEYGFKSPPDGLPAAKPYPLAYKNPLQPDTKLRAAFKGRDTAVAHPTICL
jgi:hypothetical protein